MKLRLFLALLAAVSMATPLTAQKTGSNTEEFRARIEKVWASWETMDPANAAPYYAKETDDVFFDIAPLKYSGWNEYAEGVKKVLANYSSIALHLGPDLKIHQSGNTAWTTSTFHLDAVQKKDGAKEAMDGRWTAVWERRGKDWLIVHEHASFPLGAPQGGSLYRRLGGYDAIAAVTDDFIGRLIADNQLNRFFGGVSADSQKRVRQHVVDFLCNATGGPCYYIGRTMKASHEGLGIGEGEWQLSVRHLIETMDKFQVPQKERDEVLAAVGGLKTDIVTPGK